MRLDLEADFPEALEDLPEDLPAAFPEVCSAAGFTNGISASTSS